MTMRTTGPGQGLRALSPDECLGLLEPGGVGRGPVSFETDRLDAVRREGWSVLVQGHAHKVTSEHEIQHLEQATYLEPWAPGARDVYVRIVPARISGRRIRQDVPLLPGAQP